ncbi:hypothetical protein GJ631_04720 [Natronomonas sp. CBA1123]|uniref:hypothetical protein n=1 Tax=Natronomonas sp. CBA1123 TaxID=2668070 RepID=UPI0012EA2648|nr:hypothetical protein [Natronomonas sp. CBA1123]MUV85892.1 hypothetical protein [Natronomonas sp. CBA1123]
MPAKATDSPTDYEEIDRWMGGVGWIAHPEETMQRASHALLTNDGVWLVDPIDAPGVDALIEEFGDVAGVVVLSNHHTRDADTFAVRHDVPVTLPAPMTDVAGAIDAPTDRLDVGGTLGEYELIEVARSGSTWQEYALYDGETLVASESVGAADYMRVGDERLGVMLLRRLTPPREAFADLQPNRVLSGHGPGVHEDADDALTDAIDNARRRFPKALVANGLAQVRTVAAALRT